MRPLLKLLAAGAVLAAVGPTSAAVPPVVPARKALVVIKRADFESGTLREWQQVQASAPGRVRVVRGSAAHGNHAARFEVDAGDVDARSELMWARDLVGEDDERAYSWETYYSRHFPSVGRWQVTTQWKNEGAGTPPLKIEVRGNTVALSSGAQMGFKNLWRTRLVRGRWLQFTVRIKWSSRRRVGWVSMWYEGRRVLKHRRMQTLYPGLRNYFKMGLYRDPSIHRTGVVYHDNLTVAAP